MSKRLRIYLDESSTDNNGTVAVVGGVLLDWNGIPALEMDWNRILKAFGLTALHMRSTFEDLKHLSDDEKLKLFYRVTDAINSNKSWSVAATLNHAHFNAYFGSIGKKQRMSMYATCFVLGTITVGKQLEAEKHAYDVEYVMDRGNAYRGEVERARSYLAEESDLPTHVGTLDFDSDASSMMLQAADVVSWAVRRKASGTPFPRGFEPLESIFERKQHLEQTYKEEWMQEISDELKKREKT